MPIDSFPADSPTPSVTLKERSRALPRLSFQFALIVVTLTATGALAFRNAQQGSAIAGAVTYALVSIGLSFGLFATLFLIAWIPATIGQDRQEDIHKGNPFSGNQMPPQLLPPRDPGT